MLKPYKITEKVAKKLEFEYYTLGLSLAKIALRNNLLKPTVQKHFERNHLRCRTISASMKLLHEQRLDSVRAEVELERSKGL